MSPPKINLMNKPTSPIGFGMMGLTWRGDKNPSKEQAFSTLNAAYDAGLTFWNAGEIYGTPEYNSCHLLNQYFTEYPEKAQHVILSIKGGFDAQKHAPDGTREGVRKSVDNCLRILDGKKSIDIFECARVDPKTEIEVTVAALGELVSQGIIGGIGLSEVRAETVRRAAKVHKIAAVEVEMSLWSTDVLTNGIAAACKEYEIPLVAYSPLSRGALTGQIKSVADVPAHVNHFPRFEKENLEKNLKLVEEVEQLAKRKGVTAPQVAIGWVTAMSGRNGCGLIIPIPGATTVERVNENGTLCVLTDKDMEEIDGVLRKYKVTGERYGGPVAKLSDG